MKHAHILVILATLLLIGCTPPSPTVRTIVPGVSELPAGARFVVRLESAPSTGYLWDITQPFATVNVRLLESTVEQKASKNIVGAPVDQVWVFTALTAGRTKAVFEYHRPWETNTKPLKKNIYQVIVSQ